MGRIEGRKKKDTSQSIFSWIYKKILEIKIREKMKFFEKETNKLEEIFRRCNKIFGEYEKIKKKNQDKKSKI